MQNQTWARAPISVREGGGGQAAGSQTTNLVSSVGLGPGTVGPLLSAVFEATILYAQLI